MIKNSEKIDAIISDLEDKLDGDFSVRENDSFLSNKQKEIKSFLDIHRIKYLIHFTDRQNIPSILKHGILSVEELKKRKIEYVFNDVNRQDNETDYISLSVSNMNQFVYRSFRYDKESIKHGVAIVIDAKILYKEINVSRYYCNTNAANNEVCKGDEIDDLEKMFSEVVNYSMDDETERYYDRSIDKRKSYETTDMQAEILWKNNVPINYIMCCWDLENDFFYNN